MLHIQPQFLSLAKLLDGRLFEIPEYQRAYSWTKHQRKDLFQDILRVFAKADDDGHFMAAVVCLDRGKQSLGTDEFQKMEVVDGQQRLTTLILLLNTIKLRLNAKDSGQTKISRELSELLVKPEGDELLLLQTNHDTSHHFSAYLRKGTSTPSTKASTVADREILAAIEDCHEFVESWEANTGSLAALVAVLKNRLFFLLHAIGDEKSVYTVFEVLNSRGLAVSWFDRLKSILMGTAFELEKVNTPVLIKDLHTIWRQIYAVVGLRQGLSTEALRFAATFRCKDAPSRTFGEEAAVDLLRSQATDAKSIREVADWMLQVTKACDQVTADPRIAAVSRISQARFVATALLLRSDISDAERKSLLGIWERVSFRIYGLLGHDARTAVGEFVRLAWKIINDPLDTTEIKDGLLEIGDRFPIATAIKNLRGDECYYGWEVELRYIMWRYEEHLAEANGLKFSNEQWTKIWMVSPSESIEHIWPQSTAPESIVHRLGNLVLLPPRLNSALRDKKPRDKASDYQKTGLLIAGEVATTIANSGWNKAAVIEREEKLLNWISEEWG